MNRLDLEGRVAAVTGGARGIGLAIAERATASGARVAIWDTDLAEAQAVAGRLGGFAARVDVTDQAAIAAALDLQEHAQAGGRAGGTGPSGQPGVGAAHAAGSALQPAGEPQDQGRRRANAPSWAGRWSASRARRFWCRGR